MDLKPEDLFHEASKAFDMYTSFWIMLVISIHILLIQLAWFSIG